MAVGVHCHVSVQLPDDGVALAAAAMLQRRVAVLHMFLGREVAGRPRRIRRHKACVVQYSVLKPLYLRVAVTLRHAGTHPYFHAVQHKPANFGAYEQTYNKQKQSCSRAHAHNGICACMASPSIPSR